MPVYTVEFMIASPATDIDVLRQSIQDNTPLRFLHAPSGATVELEYLNAGHDPDSDPVFTCTFNDGGFLDPVIVHHRHWYDPLSIVWVDPSYWFDPRNRIVPPYAQVDVSVVEWLWDWFKYPVMNFALGAGINDEWIVSTTQNCVTVQHDYVPYPAIRAAHGLPSSYAVHIHPATDAPAPMTVVPDVDVTNTKVWGFIPEGEFSTVAIEDSINSLTSTLDDILTAIAGHLNDPVSGDGLGVQLAGHVQTNQAAAVAQLTRTADALRTVNEGTPNRVLADVVDSGLFQTTIELDSLGTAVDDATAALTDPGSAKGLGQTSQELLTQATAAAESVAGIDGDLSTTEPGGSGKGVADVLEDQDLSVVLSTTGIETRLQSLEDELTDPGKAIALLTAAVTDLSSGVTITLDDSAGGWGEGVQQALERLAESMYIVNEGSGEDVKVSEILGGMTIEVKNHLGDTLWSFG